MSNIKLICSHVTALIWLKILFIDLCLNVYVFFIHPKKRQTRKLLNQGSLFYLGSVLEYSLVCGVLSK